MRNLGLHVTRDRDSAHTNARRAAQQLTAWTIKPPKAFAAALAALDRHEARKPTEPPADAARTLYRDGATDEQITAALIDQQTWRDRHKAWLAARADLGIDAIRQLLAAADAIHDQLTPHAAQAIDTLHRAADLPDVEVLVRDGRLDDAQLRAAAPAAATTFAALAAFRDEYLTPAGLDLTPGRHDYRTWANPEVFAAGERPTSTSWHDLAAGIRHGGELWFPTPQEAADAAAAAHQQARAEAAQKEPEFFIGNRR